MTQTEAAKQFINTAIQLINAKSNEAKIRDNFTSYLRQMFPDSPKWVSHHVEGAERHIIVQRNGEKRSGFIDNCIDNTAIEYEKNLSNTSIYEEGFRQVKEYCAGRVCENAKIETVIGILSDTLNWYVYEIVPDNNLKYYEYNQENIKLNVIAELHINQCTDRNINDLLLFLPKYLGREGARSLTSENLANDFGLKSQYGSRYVEEIEHFVHKKIKQNPSYYQLIEGLWKKFVEGFCDSGENMEYYIGEFYISIIAKLLCANLLTHKTLSSDIIELEEIINGKFFENKNVQNFVDFDYFGWLNNDINDIIDLVSTIQDELKVYDFATQPNGDLFGGLLGQLAGEKQKLMLGQDMTPIWLAKVLVNQVIEMLPEGELPHFVDMCCGSGSMIVETILATNNKLQDIPSTENKDIILRECITGFDIDPLAVILSKINWLVNIYDLIDNSEMINIPIYHADSLFIANPLTNKFKINDAKQIILLNRKIAMPNYIVNLKNDVFDSIINKCYDSINDLIENDDFCKMIRILLEGKVEEEKADDIIDFAYELYDALYHLNKEGKNGVWSFILKNSFRPILITKRFNGIVSNTPWLALSKINSNPYKKELKKLASELAIRPTNSSFPHLEIATVFLLSSIERYLQDGAAFGCILPDSVMTGGHHEKFRNGKYDAAGIKADFNYIWELPDIFKNKSIALFGTKTKFQGKKEYSGRAYTDCDIYINTKVYVCKSSSKIVWATESNNGSGELNSRYSFRQGADIMPRCFTFFDLKKTGENYEVSSIDLNSKYSYFLTYQKLGKELKYNYKGIPQALLKQVLVSNIVTPFNIGEIPMALLPIKRENRKWRQLNTVEKDSMNRATQNLINRINNDYTRETNKADFFDNALNFRNKLVEQFSFVGKFLVVYGAGGKEPCSAYLKATDEIIIDQTLYWTVVETEDEAIYLSAILNCPTLNKLITKFQPRGLFGERHVHTLPLDYIPIYDPSNVDMIEVIEVTKKFMKELSTKSASINLAKGNLQSKRKKIKELFPKISLYESYVSSCEKVILAIGNKNI